MFAAQAIRYFNTRYCLTETLIGGLQFRIIEGGHSFLQQCRFIWLFRPRWAGSKLDGLKFGIYYDWKRRSFRRPSNRLLCPVAHRRTWNLVALACLCQAHIGDPVAL